MCNEYEFETKWEEYSPIMAREAFELPASQSARDIVRRATIKVGDKGSVIQRRW